MENLLGDRVPNVMAGCVVSLLINTFFVLNVVYLNVVCILGVMSVCNDVMDWGGHA